MNFKGDRKYFADPSTREMRFAAAVVDAEYRALQKKMAYSIFETSEGVFIVRETKWCHQSLELLFTVDPPKVKP